MKHASQLRAVLVNVRDPANPITTGPVIADEIADFAADICVFIRAPRGQDSEDVQRFLDTLVDSLVQKVFVGKFLWPKPWSPGTWHPWYRKYPTGAYCGL